MENNKMPAADSVSSAAVRSGAVAWAVTAPRGGIHKLSITKESADRKAAHWQKEWPDNECAVRPLVFGDVTPVAAPVAASEPTDQLHSAIMNLPCVPPNHDGLPYDFASAYRTGHRDARHAAAELVCEVSARAADALSEPSDIQKKLDRAERALLRAGFVDNGAQEWKPPLGPAPRFIEVESVQSRAADALDSQPTESRPTDDDLWDATIRDRDAFHEWADKLADAIAAHCGVDIGEHSNQNLPWAEALAAIESADCIEDRSQPTEPAACGACHGSGRMVRDADIGTDQECFSCGGSGESDEASSQPTDGGVRNG